MLGEAAFPFSPLRMRSTLFPIMGYMSVALMDEYIYDIVDGLYMRGIGPLFLEIIHKEGLGAISYLPKTMFLHKLHILLDNVPNLGSIYVPIQMNELDDRCVRSIFMFPHL